MHDPTVSLLLRLAILLAAAKLMGWLAARVRQPAVLGEILAGILLGNLTLVGVHALEPIGADPALGVLASLGIVVLMFEVGLQSTVHEMLRVGRSSALVAILGVVTPFALGWLVGAWLLPGETALVHAFLGAVLTATSVGITARVLRDSGHGQSVEARIILGAAVLDDVLGLVILAALTGIITAAPTPSALSILAVSARALGFLFVAILIGLPLLPAILRLASRVRVPGMLLTAGLSLCFLFAWLGTLVGLSPIVGAFAAGLILESRHFRDFQESRETTIEALLQPISAFLVPVFFVLTGFRVKLDAFANPKVVLLAVALTVAAWLGKQACSLGVLERGANRLAIGLGMVPRGEVGLIFASVGASLTLAGVPVITPELYSAVVIMVLLTTVVTPGALQWSLTRGPRGRGSGGAAGASRPGDPTPPAPFPDPEPRPRRSA